MKILIVADNETNMGHKAPIGMEHHERRNKGKGLWYADVKMRHFIISLHQEHFPELLEEMKSNPTQATNIYSAFLSMIPLQVKGKLTNELKKRILRAFKLLK